MKHTILCVDDEVDNVDALERLFRRQYNVLKATSGAEALDLMRGEKVSLIVSDQRMPNMTGVEFFAKSMKIAPEAIRILLTGYTDIESVIDAINSGQVYRYVTKPWDPVDLGNTVNKAIERYELSAELKEKNAALEKALTELRTLDEAKSNFMILINHELKTPLTVILSFLELLRETDLTDEQTKYASKIAQSSERLQELINDSLELVSAETGQMPVQKVSVELKPLFQDLQRSFETEIEKKNLSVDLDLASSTVRVDKSAIRSIAQRLLDNSVKFAPPKSEIVIRSRLLDDKMVGLTIVNDGKGLNQSTLDRILKPFALDENIMHHSKGTGLGLAVVQAVLRRIGSQLEVHSPKGKFEVSFRLPAG
ncbi:MAG: response regulator [Bdellovibrionales bacterium]